MNRSSGAFGFVALVVLPCLALADDTWRFPTDRITTELWQTYRSETLAKPGATSSVAAQQLIITVPSEYAIYVFTEPGHPAHPGVVVRALVTNNGVTSPSRHGHFAGDERAFARWWHEFDALDAGVKKDTAKVIGATK